MERGEDRTWTGPYDWASEEVGRIIFRPVLEHSFQRGLFGPELIPIWGPPWEVRC